MVGWDVVGPGIGDGVASVEVTGDDVDNIIGSVAMCSTGAGNDSGVGSRISTPLGSC